MLVMKDEEETTEEAFKRLGKPGKIEDYNKRILCIIPVSVKRTSDEELRAGFRASVSGGEREF